MADPPSTASKAPYPERRRSPRFTCEERVTFDCPRKERASGVMKSLSESGCLLITMEPLKVQTEVILYLTLVRGDQKSDFGVGGKVVRISPEVKKPFGGYGVAFIEENPTIVKEVLRQLVDGGARPETVKPTPTPEPPPARSQAAVEPLNSPAGLSSASVSHLMSEAGRSSKAASSRAGMGKSRTPLYVAGALTLLGVGVLFLWETIKSSSLESELSKILPLDVIRTEETDLYARFEGGWFEKTPEADRRDQLVRLGRALPARHLYCVRFLDKANREVARVMIPMGDKGAQPVVNFYVPAK